MTVFTQSKYTYTNSTGEMCRNCPVNIRNFDFLLTGERVIEYVNKNGDTTEKTYFTISFHKSNQGDNEVSWLFDSQIARDDEHARLLQL